MYVIAWRATWNFKMTDVFITATSVEMIMSEPEMFDCRCHTYG
jgi:hypothetical protein